MNPVRVHFYERDVVAFRVVDSPEGGTARGDYGGPLPGVVRPALKWETETVMNKAQEPIAQAVLQEVPRLHLAQDFAGAAVFRRNHLGAESD